MGSQCVHVNEAQQRVPWAGKSWAWGLSFWARKAPFHAPCSDRHPFLACREQSAERKGHICSSWAAHPAYLTSARRRQTGVSPECSPPVPKCCICERKREVRPRRRTRRRTLRRAVRAVRALAPQLKSDCLSVCGGRTPAEAVQAAAATAANPPTGSM